MFFCNPCAVANRWPESMFRSYGRCEVCGNVRECSERQSSQLPKPDTARQALGRTEEKP